VKILIDTNIVLDLILERKPFVEDAISSIFTIHWTQIGAVFLELLLKHGDRIVFANISLTTIP
jgi:hypothetical protein